MRHTVCRSIVRSMIDFRRAPARSASEEDHGTHACPGGNRGEVEDGERNHALPCPAESALTTAPVRERAESARESRESARIQKGHHGIHGTHEISNPSFLDFFLCSMCSVYSVYSVVKRSSIFSKIRVIRGRELGLPLLQQCRQRLAVAAQKRKIRRHAGARMPADFGGCARGGNPGGDQPSLALKKAIVRCHDSSAAAAS
jgi:hypothetical protein